MRRSSYKDIPLQVVGQSYEHRSKALSVQKTMNLIPQSELTGAAQTSLTSWPGYKSFYDTSGNGVNRGMTVFKDELYKITNTSLFKITSVGAAVYIGSIPGEKRCIFANDGTNLIITTNGVGYQYDSTNLTQITDSDFQGGNSVAFFNLLAVCDGFDNSFQFSNIGNPDTFDAADIANAEANPDDTNRVFVFRDQLYVCGEKTIETWYYNAATNPPANRVQNATMQVGIGAIHSMQATDEFVYFLGDDRRVYRFSATQPQNITTIAISHQLDKLGDLSDAIGDIVRIEGQSFYILTAQGKTFAYNEEANAWFNLSTKADEESYPLNSFVECYGKRLAANGADVVELDLDTYDNGGDVMINERIFGPITASSLGLGSSRVMMSSIYFDIEAGVGLTSGQGENPQLMVSASYDGGRSYDNERDVLLGRAGEGRLVVKWDNCTSFKTMYVRVRCSDPVFISIFGATLKAKAGGY